MESEALEALREEESVIRSKVADADCRGTAATIALAEAQTDLDEAGRAMDEAEDELVRVLARIREIEEES